MHDLVIRKIVNYQKERELDKQPFEFMNEATNVIEELVEINGYLVPKEKRVELRKQVEKFFNMLPKELGLKKNPDEHKIPDGFSDIIVFSIGAMMKDGWRPKCCLNETVKEIRSREGKIINGKFQKFTTPEYTKKWYKANYSRCHKFPITYKEDGIMTKTIEAIKSANWSCKLTPKDK